jgi:hypothetical protein
MIEQNEKQGTEGPDLLTEPVKFVDGLVKGSILAAYDFGRLTILGLAFSFVKGSRRFWPAVISLTRHISSLTFLFLWTGIASLFYLQFNELGTIVLSGGAPNVQTIICTFVLTVSIDLIIRLCCWPIRLKTRRDLYESLFRIGAGIVYFGTVATPLFRLPEGYTNLVLGFFALPLAVISMKAVRAKRELGRVAIAAAFVLFIPTLVFKSGLIVAFAAYQLIDSWKPKAQPHVDIWGRDIRCIASGNRVEVTGYLSTDHDFLAVAPHDFRAGYIHQSTNFDLGQPEDSDPSIALKKGSYTKFAFSSRPILQPGQQLPSEPFRCDLVTLRSFWGESSNPIQEYRRPDPAPTE